MGVKRLCICISKGGYFWNDGGTRLDERWEGGVINPWVDAFTEQYQVHQGKARCLGGLHSARGVAFIRMMRSRGCRLIIMCFIYINGLCNVDAALIFVSGQCVYTRNSSLDQCVRARISR